MSRLAEKYLLSNNVSLIIIVRPALAPRPPTPSIAHTSAEDKYMGSSIVKQMKAAFIRTASELTPNWDEYKPTTRHRLYVSVSSPLCDGFILTHLSVHIRSQSYLFVPVELT